jgi:prepilin-type N-terminal cleavage/methylation domain-containing protein
MRHYVRRRKGFTLIELLVVVAIIAVLIALLLPAIQQARGRAKQVVCQAQLEQLAQVTRQYGDDNNEKPPPAIEGYWPPSGGGWYRWFVHMERTGYIKGNTCTGENTIPNIWCPAESHTRYAMNADICGFTFSNIPRPSQVLMFCDGGSDTGKSFVGIWTTGSSYNDAMGYVINSDAHFKGVDLAFCDGHVGWQKGYIPCWCSGFNDAFNPRSLLWPWE